MSQCGPPGDRARNYATFKRHKNGQAEEMRVGIEEYNGHSFASLRLWTPGLDGSGQLYPSRLSATIRRSELAGAIEALTRIARDLGVPLGDDDGPTNWRHYGGDGGPPRPKPGPKPKPDVSVDHAQLYAGQGRRRVDLSEACRSAAFQMLTNPATED